jgi:hypothetical protein
MPSQDADQSVLLKEVLDALKALQANQTQLASHIDSIASRVDILAGIKEVQEGTAVDDPLARSAVTAPQKISHGSHSPREFHDLTDVPDSPSFLPNEPARDKETIVTPSARAQKPGITSRIILT